MTAPGPPALPPLALVTGGTRRLGAAIAARLARDGHALALHYREHEACEPALVAAMAAAGTNHALFAADLADEAALEALVPRVVARFGRAPDVLVNSASLWSEDDVSSATLASYVDHFRINAAAPTILAQRVAERARGGAGRGAAGGVAIVNILDQRIAHPHGDQLSYTASKLAFAEMTRLMARVLAPHARVMGVAPGLTIPTGDYGAEQMVRLAAAMPLGRLPTPGDVADAVAYAIGARAATGHVLFVDGGASLESYPADFVAMARD